MKYSSKDISSILECSLLNTSSVQADLRLIAFDTRTILFAQKSLFFALSGHKSDGHQYLKDAYHKGIRNFVVSQKTKVYPDANYYLVEDTLLALQQLARYHRSLYDLKVIAITGSYAKTIVKDWLYECLKEDYAVVKSPKSYNSQIGVAISLLQIQEHHEIAIIEAGISQKGEMTALQLMIKPDIGVFTNLGEAHNSGFENAEEKLIEKLLLFKSCQKVICLPAWKKRLSQHLDNQSIYSIDDMYSSTLADPIHQKNIQTTATALYYLGYSKNKIKDKLKNLSPLKMRLEILKGPDNCIIINDAYIADLSSLEIALSTLSQQSENRSKWLIISDFDISQSEEAQTYSKLNELLTVSNLDKIWVLGNRMRKFITHPDISYFSTLAEIGNQLKHSDFTNQAILIKGARKYGLEHIAKLISLQVHDTKLEINLTALKHNLNSYAALLDDRTKIIGVIKAGAYGSGSPEIAKILVQNGVNRLAVAYTDEALELRKAGIKTPIIILNPPIQAETHYIEHGLEPIIFSTEQLDSTIKLTEQNNQKLTIHLNINTGMNRLGIEPEELIHVIPKIKNAKLHLQSVFTHLSASEDSMHDAYSSLQIDRFSAAYRMIQGAFQHTIMRHVLNTTGILRFPHYQMDAVRLGLGLYGINLTNRSIDLQKVHNLTSKIIQIKEYDDAVSIGYSRKHYTNKAEKIATIPIGYADGLPRLAGNGNYSLLIKGYNAPIVGNICMDLLMIDISSIPDARVGDEAVIFNDKHPIEQLAKVCQTIPYEILSNISPRVQRILIEE